MCINELFGSLIDIVSLVFVLIDIFCYPCDCTGLEVHTFVRVFKILTGIELINEHENKKLRQFIVKCVFIPFTVLPVFLMNLVECVLLIDANENFSDINSTNFTVNVLLIISLIDLLVYLILMVYFACATKKLKSLRFHRLCLIPFHTIDMIINILMLVQCFFKPIQPGLNIVFIIFVLSVSECFFSFIQVIKSVLFLLLNIKEDKRKKSSS